MISVPSSHLFPYMDLVNWDFQCSSMAPPQQLSKLLVRAAPAWSKGWVVPPNHPFSIINHPFWGTTIFRKHPYTYIQHLYSSISRIYPYSENHFVLYTKQYHGVMVIVIYIFIIWDIIYIYIFLMGTNESINQGVKKLSKLPASRQRNDAPLAWITLVPSLTSTWMELRLGTRETTKTHPTWETRIFPILDGILLVPGRVTTMSLALRLTSKQLDTKGVEMILVLKAFLFVREIS